MAIYVNLTTLTDAGRKILHDNPKRIKEVNKEMEKTGIKLLHQYALLGTHDFINIIEAPDNETVHRFLIDQGSRGSHYSVSMPALDVDAFIESMKIQENI